MEKIEFPDQIDSMMIYLEYDNQFDFGATINILAATDTTYFHENSPTPPDTLISSLTLKANTSSIDSIILDQTKIDIFSLDPLYLDTQISLQAEDTIFFLSTDTLTINVFVSMDYMINEPTD